MYFFFFLLVKEHVPSALIDLQVQVVQVKHWLSGSCFGSMEKTEQETEIRARETGGCDYE